MSNRKVTYKPLGARLLVEPIITTVSLEERAAQAQNAFTGGRGIEIVLEHENVPMPTQGRVVALGSDPLLHEEIKVGDIVFFNKYAGHEVALEGHVYRQLEHSEVTGVMQEELSTEQSPVDSPTDQTLQDSPEPSVKQ